MTMVQTTTESLAESYAILGCNAFMCPELCMSGSLQKVRSHAEHDCVSAGDVCYTSEASHSKSGCAGQFCALLCLRHSLC